MKFAIIKLTTNRAYRFGGLTEYISSFILIKPLGEIYLRSIRRCFGSR